MAENINDGGRAFPVHPGSNPDGGSAGMSLRDWFAGQALASVAQNTDHLGLTARASGKDPTEVAAIVAYGFADAMLAARSR